MKSLIAITIIFIQFSLIAQRNPFDFGIEGGMNIGTLRGNSLIDENHSLKPGSIFGISFQYNLPKLLSIKTGLSFEQKGSKFSVPAVDINGNYQGDYKGTITFNYLTIPLVTQFSFGQKWRPFVNFGGFCSILISQKERVQAFSNYPGSTTNYTDLFKRTEFGLTGGLGLSYSMEMPLAVSVEVRNNLGLTNISDIEVYGGGQSLTNTLNLLIGISYQIGKD